MTDPKDSDILISMTTTNNPDTTLCPACGLFIDDADLDGHVCDWMDTDTEGDGPFVDGYIECAFWVGVNDLSDNSDLIYEGLGKSDLSDEALSIIRNECADFVLSNRADLAAVGTPAQHGHDFFLTRNGHGAGFWDRGYGEVGDRLTEACRPYGEQYLYLSDDGTVEV